MENSEIADFIPMVIGNTQHTVYIAIVVHITIFCGKPTPMLHTIGLHMIDIIDISSTEFTLPNRGHSKTQHKEKHSGTIDTLQVIEQGIVLVGIRNAYLLHTHNNCGHVETSMAMMKRRLSGEHGGFTNSTCARVSDP